MTRHVALLRAINVGGRVVRMEQLRRIFESLGFGNVSTVINSGNVLFESPKSPAALEAAIERRLEMELGYPVLTFIRNSDELRAIVAHRPFKDDRPGSLHVLFLKMPPSRAAATTLIGISNDTDRFQVRGREVYWHAGKGLGQSTFTGAKLEKLVGPATARNVTTVRRLAEK